MAYLGNYFLDILVSKFVIGVLIVLPVCYSRIEDLGILVLIRDFG
jgi:hypothetical protein